LFPGKFDLLVPLYGIDQTELVMDAKLSSMAISPVYYETSYQRSVQQSAQVQQRYAESLRRSQERLVDARRALDQSSDLLARSRLHAQVAAEPKGLLVAGALERV
jgi:hypothetical protein